MSGTHQGDLAGMASPIPVRSQLPSLAFWPILGHVFWELTKMGMARTAGSVLFVMGSIALYPKKGKDVLAAAGLINSTVGPTFGAIRGSITIMQSWLGRAHGPEVGRVLFLTLALVTAICIPASLLMMSWRYILADGFGLPESVAKHVQRWYYGFGPLLSVAFHQYLVNVTLSSKGHQGSAIIHSLLLSAIAFSLMLGLDQWDGLNDFPTAVVGISMGVSFLVSLGLEVLHLKCIPAFARYNFFGWSRQILREAWRDYGREFRQASLVLAFQAVVDWLNLLVFSVSMNKRGEDYGAIYNSSSFYLFMVELLGLAFALLFKKMSADLLHRLIDPAENPEQMRSYIRYFLGAALLTGVIYGVGFAGIATWIPNAMVKWLLSTDIKADPTLVRTAEQFLTTNAWFAPLHFTRVILSFFLFSSKQLAFPMAASAVLMTGLPMAIGAPLLIAEKISAPTFAAFRGVGITCAAAWVGARAWNFIQLPAEQLVRFVRAQQPQTGARAPRRDAETRTVRTSCCSFLGKCFDPRVHVPPEQRVPGTPEAA